MKITNINGRVDFAGKHNDRNFDLNAAPHIDQNKLNENKYFTYNGDSERTFVEVEKEFYDVHFSDHIKSQNEKNAQNYHKDRNRTVEDYFRNVRTKPEDKILQIGNVDEHASGEELWECALEYQRKFDEIYGDHCKILTMALHMDEATPHVHIRRVWMAENEQGNEYVSQSQALEQMGFPAPEREKTTSKHNNGKILFTQTDTELFRNICIEKGLNIDPPSKRKMKHLSVSEFKEKKMVEHVEELERTAQKLQDNIEAYRREIQESESTVNSLLDAFEQIAFINDIHQNELQEVRRQDIKKRMALIDKIISSEIAPLCKGKQDLAAAISKRESSHTEARMKNFLKRNHLYEQYKKEEFAHFKGF